MTLINFIDIFQFSHAVLHVWGVFHVLFARTFVFGLCAKNPKNFFLNPGFLQPQFQDHTDLLEFFVSCFLIA